MGTRGLLGHIIRGRKRGTYNHFDSYPSGLGANLIQFIMSLSSSQIETMKTRLEQVEWVGENSTPSQELQTRYMPLFGNLQVNTQSPDNWYCLLHGAQGAAALPHILDGTLEHLIDNTEFEEDGLFCEWAYWVDWEKHEVTVRSGFSGGVAIRPFATLSDAWMASLADRLESDEGVELPGDESEDGDD